jgi:uncharacterized membrane protein
MGNVLAIAFALGVVTGLRSMTGLAVVCWAARLGWINFQNTWAAWLGHAATVYIFTALAVGELIGDKLPKTPSRKSPAPFAGRIVIGAAVGAALATAKDQSLVAGALCGGVGAVAGTLGGYEVRTRLVTALGVPDFVIAVLEDAVAVSAAFFLVSKL